MNTKVKRFYSNVDVVANQDGFLVELDKRAVKSPGKQNLILPHEKMAKCLADEWRQQEEFIDQAIMPIQKFSAMVTDSILPNPHEAHAEILKYAHSDLLCYQSEGPKDLVERQKSLWDPVLAQFKRDENIGFNIATGVSYLKQNAGDMERFAALIAPLQAYELGAIYQVTTMSGSALLAMALHKKWLDADDVWKRSHLDEDYQQEQWGADEDETERRQRRYADFRAACSVYDI